MVFSIRGGEWWVPTVGTGIIHLAQGCEYFALEAFSSFDRGIAVCYCLLPSSQPHCCLLIGWEGR